MNEHFLADARMKQSFQGRSEERVLLPKGYFDFLVGFGFFL
jgi:hypothetical protein